MGIFSKDNLGLVGFTPVPCWDERGIVVLKCGNNFHVIAIRPKGSKPEEAPPPGFVDRLSVYQTTIPIPPGWVDPDPCPNPPRICDDITSGDD